MVKFCRSQWTWCQANQQQILHFIFEPKTLLFDLRTAPLFRIKRLKKQCFETIIITIIFCLLQLFNVAKLNAPMLSDLPAALDAVRDRLESRPSIVDSLPSDSCLRLSQDSDAYFLGELQTLDDILTKVRA